MTIQPEELNKIEQGKRYGWPHVWGDGGLNPQSTPPGEVTKAQWKADSVPMALGYKAHAAPMQMTFAKGGGMFPAEYARDAFVTMRGSWNRQAASRYEIVRIRFADGQPQRFETFASGFLTDGGRTHIARPVGLAWAKDGALLMADDANGVIYRIAYQGSARTAPAMHVPADEMKRQAGRGVGVPLAKDRPETATASTAPIQLSSSSFTQGAAMPAKHSEYADGVSPALRWNAVVNAKSYILLAEDPDAKPITPFVHWVAWNIPTNVTSLPEGLQEQDRLTEPAGLMQGANSRGSVGYHGPRPPVGDPPHHYHFQILALDTLLQLPLGSNRDEVLATAKGHVLAKGELLGTYRQDVKPPK